jgi:hypothetical protein
LEVRACTWFDVIARGTLELPVNPFPVGSSVEIGAGAPEAVVPVLAEVVPVSDAVLAGAALGV